MYQLLDEDRTVLFRWKGKAEEEASSGAVKLASHSQLLPRETAVGDGRVG